MGFIFDMGNVLALDVDVLPGIAERTGISIPEIERYSGDDFPGLLTGVLGTAEYWRGFNRHFGTDVREDLMITLFHPVIDPRMLALIRGLKADGHRVVCGTNAFDTHYRYHVEHGEYEVFDQVYASNVIGIAKPDPAFFEHILAAEAWQAAGTFFVDDRAENIHVAQELGLRAFLYDSFDRFAAWLAVELDGRRR
jgi:glucose-1-phosphatase